MLLDSLKAGSGHHLVATPGTAGPGSPAARSRPSLPAPRPLPRTKPMLLPPSQLHQDGGATWPLTPSP